MAPDSDNTATGTSTPPHISKNRAVWNATSDEYEERHAAVLDGDLATAWGLWRIPEAKLQILGPVRDKDILELGCGAARWSIALARQGARPVGLDFSSRQLAHARHLQRAAGLGFPLIEASAEAVPLHDEGFDIVFCDWGALTFADPHRAVPEAARLLRPGGLLAFATASPFANICQDLTTEAVVPQLTRDYFGLHRLELSWATEFNLPYGAWLRLFRDHGLTVEDLIETQPAPGVASTYRDEAENAWARRWPMEHIWRVRKAG